MNEVSPRRQSSTAGPLALRWLVQPPELSWETVGFLSPDAEGRPPSEAGVKRCTLCT